LFASALPILLLASVVTVAVNSAAAVRIPRGVKVAVNPEYSTTPGIDVAPCLRVNEEVLIVDGFIASLKETDSTLFRATSVSLLNGAVEVTIGFKPLSMSTSSSLQLVVITASSNATIGIIVFNLIFIFLLVSKLLIKGRLLCTQNCYIKFEICYIIHTFVVSANTKFDWVLKNL
jgi:hypothetical protein